MLTRSSQRIFNPMRYTGLYIYTEKSIYISCQSESIIIILKISSYVFKRSDISFGSGIIVYHFICNLFFLLLLFKNLNCQVVQGEILFGKLATVGIPW